MPAWALKRICLKHPQDAASGNRLPTKTHSHKGLRFVLDWKGSSLAPLSKTPLDNSIVDKFLLDHLLSLEWWNGNSIYSTVASWMAYPFFWFLQSMAIVRWKPLPHQENHMELLSGVCARKMLSESKHLGTRLSVSKYQNGSNRGPKMNPPK